MIRKQTFITLRESNMKLFGVRGLKVCPVCDTLATDDSDECHVCCWSGSFCADPKVVELKLAELVQRCPELEGMIERRQTFKDRIRYTLWKMWSKLRVKLDVIA